MTMACLWLLSVSLLVCAWIISSFISPPSQPPLLNYGHTVYFDPSKVHSPATKEEILSVVYDTLENGRRLRVLGSGQSWSSIALSEDVMVSLHRYKGVFRFDQAAKQVTVKGGTTVGEIVHYLEERGLALSSLPASTEQTISGAISTSAHGAGTSIASMVIGLELITGEGETLTLSNTSHPDIFRAALVSMGLLGIITKVTLQCVPAFHVEEKLERVSLDYCIQQLPSIATSGEYVTLWTEAYSNTCAVVRGNRTGHSIGRNDIFKTTSLKMRFAEIFLFFSSWFPHFTPFIMQFISEYIDVFPAYSRVDKSYNVFVPAIYFPQHLRTEISVKMSDCSRVMQLLHDMILSNQLPANLFTKIQFVKRDDIWLSPGYLRDGCYVSLMLYNPSDKTVSSYFNTFYHELVRLKLTPRVHFGMHFDSNLHCTYNDYPQLPEFLKIRDELDPNNIFLNQLIKVIFDV